MATVAGVGTYGESDVPARAAITSFPPDGKKKRAGRSRTDWMQSVKQDISRGDFSWNDLPAGIDSRQKSTESTDHPMRL